MAFGYGLATAWFVNDLSYCFGWQVLPPFIVTISGMLRMAYPFYHIGLRFVWFDVFLFFFLRQVSRTDTYLLAVVDAYSLYVHLV